MFSGLSFKSPDRNAVESIDLRMAAISASGTPPANIATMADVLAGGAPETPFQSAAKKKRVQAVVLALILVAGGGFVWWAPQRSTGAGSSAKTALPLETFVVNLTGSSQRAYLRIGITLELAHPLSSRSPAESAPMAAIRDTILLVLATAQPEDLLQAEGKRRLKDELLQALQRQVPQIAVENIYFTEFLVQM